MPWHFAAKDYHMDVMKVLFREGGDQGLFLEKSYLYTPFYMATMSGDIRLIQFLFDAVQTLGVDFKNYFNGDVENWGPLDGAAFSGNLELMQYIYGLSQKYGNEKSKTVDFAFYLAAQHGYLPIVQFLFEKGANVNGTFGINSPNAVNGGKFTPLHLAAENGHTDIVVFLLDHGAAVNIPNDDGTPLHAAVKGGHYDIVEILIAHNAPLNLLIRNRYTPCTLR